MAEPNVISVSESVSPSDEFALFPFFSCGRPVPGAVWGMSLLRAGSMRFRWNERNDNRKKIIDFVSSAVGNSRKMALSPVELVHSKKVVESSVAGDTEEIVADGIVTKNPSVVPVVTVADCVPIFLYDPKTGAVGALHSGWKGTGIAAEGISMMAEKFGSDAGSVLAAIGPHIGGCCYNIDRDRAGFFAGTFGKACVSEKNGGFFLSLTEANLAVLRSAGIRDENITVSSDCTCCSSFPDGSPVFGSFRRQSAPLPPTVTADERSRAMTVQSALAFLFPF